MECAGLDDVARTITLKGFDPAGEPEIRLLHDGTLYVVFNFMPPSFCDKNNLGGFDNFDRQLEEAVGVPVVWEDRELLCIAKSEPDTIARLQRFIQDYRKTHTKPEPSWGKALVRQRIFDSLVSVVSTSGFRLKKSESAFVRKIPEGKQTISISLIDYSPKFLLATPVCIRLDTVESIFNMFSGSPPKYHAITVTSITQLEYFTSGRRKEYAIANEAELSNVQAKLSTVVTEKIIPLLNEVQDCLALDKLLNAESNLEPNVRRIPFDSSHHPAGAMSAVIVAHLAKNPDFEQIVSGFQQEMSLFDSSDDRFNRLVQYLRDLKA